MMSRTPPPLSQLLVVVALAGSCASSPEQPSPVVVTVPATGELHPASPFSSQPTVHRLTILHTSDNESDLLGSERDDDKAAPHGGIARAATLVRALTEQAAAQDEPVLLLAAGDTWMPAPELHLDIDGVSAVTAANNLLGYKASALGNHEWDLGEAFLAEQLAKAAFPYLSATIDVTEGPLLARTLTEEQLSASGAWASESAGKLAPRTRICIGALDAASPEVPAASLSRCRGLVVGVVGATTEALRGISNVPDHVGLASNLEQVRLRVQRQVDALTTEGVTLIVLVSHLQDVRKELRLVEDGLTGVDIIIAGGGDNRLASTGHVLLPGDTPDAVCASSPEDCYPLVRTARDGRPVLVVATDGQLRYVGVLKVDFDADGVLAGFSPGSRAWPVDEMSLLALNAPPLVEAVALEARVHDEMAAKAVPFAMVKHFLEGRREEVRNRQTNLGDLSADAMAWAGRRHAPKGYAPRFALRNGGGIRAPIGRFHRDTYAREGGPLRLIDVESALRFDGGLVVVRATHAALRETLEASLRGVGGGRGQFPQVSGEVLLEYAREAPEQLQTIHDGHVTGVSCPGLRVRTLKIKDPAGEVVTIVENGRVKTPDARIDFVTLAFLAKGGDGWFPGRAKALEVRALRSGSDDVTEQSSFRGFIQALDERGAWDEGAGWPDPVPGRPDTFTRIRELDGVIERDAASSCG